MHRKTSTQNLTLQSEFYCCLLNLQPRNYFQGDNFLSNVPKFCTLSLIRKAFKHILVIPCISYWRGWTFLHWWRSEEANCEEIKQKFKKNVQASDLNKLMNFEWCLAKLSSKMFQGFLSPSKAWEIYWYQRGPMSNLRKNWHPLSINNHKNYNDANKILWN